MILVAIIALSGVVLAALYAVLVGFPTFPAGVDSAVTAVLSYLSQGCAFIYYFIDGRVISRLITVTLAYEVIVNGYKFVMWVAKKIPMLGVSD